MILLAASLSNAHAFLARSIGVTLADSRRYFDIFEAISSMPVGDFNGYHHLDIGLCNYESFHTGDFLGHVDESFPLETRLPTGQNRYFFCL